MGIAADEATKRQNYAHLKLTPAVGSCFGRPREGLITLVRSLCRNPGPEERAADVSFVWQDWASTLQQWNARFLAMAGPLISP